MRGLLVLAMTLLVVLASILATVAMPACSPSYATCYRGEYQGCTCASGEHGYQACDVTQGGFQDCVCDGTTPGVDGGRDAAPKPGLEAGSGGAYLAACGASGTCAAAEDICFTFPSKGQICTKKCTTAADCPAPSPGCTPNNGVCRAP